jgi:UDP-N-acetylmuramyl pentapeptide synthase
MNELGAISEDEHGKLGEMCDPALLAWVVTVGDEAEKFLAPAARARGCQVKSFHSAIDAGTFVRGVTEPGAVILAKGSQGDIYVEEAVKILCLLGEDDELVRQSRQWMTTKEAFFSKFA